LVSGSLCKENDFILFIKFLILAILKVSLGLDPGALA